MARYKYSFRQAREAVGGIKGVMTKLGDHPQHEHKWKNMPSCPFCGEKDKAGVYAKDGIEFFKCHKPGCNSGNKVMSEVPYIAARKGLSMEKPMGGGASPAYEFFLKLAGCWEEPSAEPPKAEKPKPKKSEPTPPGPEGEAKKDELPNPVIPPEVEIKAEEKAEAKTEPVAPTPKPEGESKKPEETQPDDDIPGRRATERFFSQLTLLELDEQLLFDKRGLTSATSHALRFVSNPVMNRQILERMIDEFEGNYDELLQSGLFLPEDKKGQKPFRANSQFYGMGTKGKKPKDQRRNNEDRWFFGLTHPIIIPYFDERGMVVKLRPHKGGAPANTLSGMSRLYIPRDPVKMMDKPETFYRVVITEGEFKAAALWQMLGAGRDDGEKPWGVCAVPGINFGANYDLRSELDAWLQAVDCRQIVVAYDDQDKSDKPMRERHDALIWARYLASDLARTRHVRAKVLVLPSAWRDTNGKSDWDGALAAMVAGKIRI